MNHDKNEHTSLVAETRAALRDAQLAAIARLKQIAAHGNSENATLAASILLNIRVDHLV